jgi:hypothetical protein
MFDENEVKSTPDPAFPRLIRNIFFGLSISNDNYLERYYHYYRDRFRDKTRKEFSQKAAADRKFLLDRRKLTYNMFRSVMEAMGYNVECISVRIRDNLTGEVRTFSTDDSVEKLSALVEQEKEVGLSSLT